MAEADPLAGGAAADALVAAGYEVLLTGDGRDVLRLARQQQIDAIVLELVLRGRPGLEVLQALRTAPDTRAIPVIVASGSARLMLPHEARRADGVLQKPFRMAEVLALVGRAVAGQLRRTDSRPEGSGDRPEGSPIAPVHERRAPWPPPPAR